VPTTTSTIARAARQLCAAGCAIALTTTAHGLLAQTPQQSPPEHQPLITDLRLNGVRHVDANELLLGLATKRSKCRSLLMVPLCWISRAPTFYDRRHLDPVEFRRDVLRIRLYYWRRGYRDATVESKTERAGAGVRVVFNVDEKQPTIVQKLDVEQTEQVLPGRVINGAMQVKAGEPLDLIAMDSTISLLRDAMWQRGYADAEVELDTARMSTALKSGPVTLRLKPGHLTKVRAIEIAGNDKVSTRTIGHLLDFRPGDLYRRDDVLESQRHLYLSGMFSQVNVQTPPSADAQKVVQLRVTEADLHRLDLNAGFTTADFVQLGATFNRFNYLGGARRLTLRGTLSNLFAPQLNGGGMFEDVTNGAVGSDRNRFLQPTWSASIELLQPWFLSPRNQLGTSIFTHRRSVPGVVIDQGAGATLGFTHEFQARTNSTLGYTFESSAVDASDVYFCVSFGVCEATTIRAISGRHVLSPLSSVSQIDQTNDPFLPNRGYKARLDLEHAAQETGSDFHYNRLAVTGSTYFRVSKYSTLAARVRIGWVHALGGTNAALNLGPLDSGEVVHPSKRFYAGGSQSVRGYGENQLGPRVLAISPLVLTDTARAGACTLVEVQNATCDPNRVAIASGLFLPQPLGGTSLVEASIEYRFPLVIAQGLSGAIFIDGATVGTDRFSKVLGNTTAITPGFGVRFDTPVGPVRLDLGIRPTLVENLPVVTQITKADGTLQLVTLKTPRKYNPLDVSGSGFQQVLNRLQLHLAIGPAF
jgi:outer membrane protein insertion porin family